MPWLPRKTVVVPVDFSDSSADALATAKQLVANPADLHVIHVLLPLDYMSPGMVFDTLTEESRVAATQKHFAEFVKQHDVAGARMIVRHGDPGLGVTEYAREVGAELIVIPSHGYHGIRRFVLGSVAERVIRHADCPVLVLRRRDAK
ncbi:MAG: universal stress protein [Planctomycetaceae bacterium]